jgi:hypothetical protein
MFRLASLSLPGLGIVWHAILPLGDPADAVGKGKKDRNPLGTVAHRERFGGPFDQRERRKTPLDADAVKTGDAAPSATAEEVPDASGDHGRIALAEAARPEHHHLLVEPRGIGKHRR